MRATLLVLLATLLLPAGTALAEDEPGGELNPAELTMDYFARELEAGRADPIASSHGFFAVKAGDPALARRIFAVQVRRGSAQAMTGMAWLDDNGLGAPENPAAAAEWDRQSAAAGSAVGALNYGIDLLRGRGVAQDQALGRRYVEQAAEAGDDSARRLIDHHFDLDVVTPDSDNEKYAPPAY